MIELKGVNFINKGAELMLYGLINKLKMNGYEDYAMIPDNQLFFFKRAENKIWQKSHLRKFGINFDFLINYLPKGVRKNYGIISEDDITGVLDASGFAYSDQWGIKYVKETLAQIKKIKKRNKPYILLPQAFGPFENKRIKKKMEQIIKYADIIYARDKTSFNYLIKLAKSEEKIRLSPDFTCLVDPVIPNNLPAGKKVCFIPNQRMLDKTNNNTAINYFNFLVKIIKKVSSLNYNCFFLIHDSGNDKILAQKINDILPENKRIEIYEYSSALEIKGAISTCDFIFSSRFHGIVSALTQGIPAFATGWSHKYEELMNDFQFSEGLLDIDIDDNKLNYLINNIDNMKEKISYHKMVYKVESEKMWDEVFSVMNRYNINKN